MMSSMPGGPVPDDFERMWEDLAPIGRSASSGGYFRQPFHAAERELSSWFEEQCAARSLALQTDPVGNTVGWWDPDLRIVPLVSPVYEGAPPAEREGLSRRGG